MIDETGGTESFTISAEERATLYRALTAELLAARALIGSVQIDQEERDAAQHRLALVSRLLDTIGWTVDPHGPGRALSVDASAFAAWLEQVEPPPDGHVFSEMARRLHRDGA